MARWFALLLILCACAAPQPKSEPIFVCILPLEGDSALGEAVSSRLAELKGIVRPVDAQVQAQLLRQIKVADERSALRFGRMLGADVVALGTLSQPGHSRILMLRLLQVKTGRMLRAVAVQAPAGAKTGMLSKRAAERLSVALKRRN